MQTRNMLILAGVQAAEGTPATLTGGANAMLVRNITPKPVNANFVDRELIRPFFGNSGKVQVGQYSTISFEVEVAGAGTAGNVPKYGPLLRAAGFAENITPSTSVAYTPVTEDLEFITLHFYLDGVLFEMNDCRANVSMNLNASQIPVYQFDVTGLFGGKSDSANATPDYSGFTAPLGVTKANTPTFDLHGHALCATELSIDLQNQINYANYIGKEAVEFSDRQPSGSAVFRHEALATIDWYEKNSTGELGALSFVHGTTAGNIVEIAAPKVQATELDNQDKDGIAMIGTSLEFQPDTGNDELVITVR